MAWYLPATVCASQDGMTDVSSGGESDIEDLIPREIKGTDIANLGRFTDRKTVLEHGLLHIVRRVQRADGFCSYAQYEATFNDLLKHVQLSVAYQSSLMTAKSRANSNELMKLCCELSTMLAGSEICKQMQKGKQQWEPIRRYILQKNGWEIGTNSFSHGEFKHQSKLLQTCYSLYAGTDGDSRGSSDDPFARDGIFGPPDSHHNGGWRAGGGGGGSETRKCNACGEVGHLARNCRKKTGNTMKCFRCQEMGHAAKDCDNERKPP
jgi:hypothetical protein